MDPAAQLPKHASSESLSLKTHEVEISKDEPLKTLTHATARQSFATQNALKEASDSNPRPLSLMTVTEPSSNEEKVSVAVLGNPMTPEEDLLADALDEDFGLSDEENPQAFEEDLADEFDAQFDRLNDTTSDVSEEDLADALDDYMTDSREEDAGVGITEEAKGNKLKEENLDKAIYHVSDIAKQDVENRPHIELLTRMIKREKTIALEFINGNLVESELEERHFNTDKIILFNKELGTYVHIGLSDREKTLIAIHPILIGLRSIELSKEVWFSSRDFLRNLFISSKTSETKEKELIDKSPVETYEIEEQRLSKSKSEKPKITLRREDKSSNSIKESKLEEERAEIKAGELHHIQEHQELEREEEKAGRAKARSVRDLKKDEQRYRHLGSIDKRSYLEREVIKEKGRKNKSDPPLLESY